MKEALIKHWPEYLIEAWALGTFMISAGLCATLLGSPSSLVAQMLGDAGIRNVLAGIAMGLTAIAIIHSRWGKRSGAHMNPAVTLTYLRLGRIRPWDALFFVLAQTLGGTLGVLIVAAAMGHAFTDPPVDYAATIPGVAGAAAAFVAEAIISAGMMLTVLMISSSVAYARFTGIAAGCLVTLYISVESPLSGMSMNPARTLASAIPSMTWESLWVYLTAPVLGMLAGAQLFLTMRSAQSPACAKLLHPSDVRCIHCGYEPAVSPISDRSSGDLGRPIP
jgi:aquaporin Z